MPTIDIPPPVLSLRSFSVESAMGVGLLVYAFYGKLLVSAGAGVVGGVVLPVHVLPRDSEKKYSLDIMWAGVGAAAVKVGGGQPLYVAGGAVAGAAAAHYLQQNPNV